MPVSFLSTTQRERYGHYPEALSADELAPFGHEHINMLGRYCLLYTSPSPRD